MRGTKRAITRSGSASSSPRADSLIPTAYLFGDPATANQIRPDFVEGRALLAFPLARDQQILDILPKLGVRLQVELDRNLAAGFVRDVACAGHAPSFYRRRANSDEPDLVARADRLAGSRFVASQGPESPNRRPRRETSGGAMTRAPRDQKAHQGRDRAADGSRRDGSPTSKRQQRSRNSRHRSGLLYRAIGIP